MHHDKDIIILSSAQANRPRPPSLSLGLRCFFFCFGFDLRLVSTGVLSIQDILHPFLPLVPSSFIHERATFRVLDPFRFPSPAAKKRHPFPLGSVTTMVQTVNVTLDDFSPVIEYSPPGAWMDGSTTDPFYQS